MNQYSDAILVTKGQIALARELLSFKGEAILLHVLMAENDGMLCTPGVVSARYKIPEGTIRKFLKQLKEIT